MKGGRKREREAESATEESPSKKKGKADESPIKEENVKEEPDKGKDAKGDDKDKLGRLSAVQMIAQGSAAFVEAGNNNGYTARDRAAKDQEAHGEIRFTVIRNDGSRQNLVWLAGLRVLFCRQLPKMPKDYIVRLVFDRQHKSLALIKNNHVVGGICFRPVYENHMYEIAFCAVSSNEQVQGYGTRLMNHLKAFAQTEKVYHFLTYADNFAVGYFKKQGFHLAVTHMDPNKWRPYIKDYEGATVMEAVINPNVDYLNLSAMIQRQRALVYEKIKEKSNSHIIYNGLPESFFTDKNKKAEDIPGLTDAGWKPSSARHNTRAGTTENPTNDLKNQLRTVYKAVHCHSAAWPFQEPVDRDEVPDYYEVVKDPIDLQEVSKRLENDYYKTKEIFLADMKRMFNNCRTYNGKDTIYYRYADTLEAFTLSKVRQLVL